VTVAKVPRREKASVGQMLGSPVLQKYKRTHRLSALANLLAVSEK
jgi:hypothetical protein